MTQAQATPAGQVWQDISTAPKDGSYMLLRFEGPFHDSEFPGCAVGKAIDREPGFWLTAGWGGAVADRQPTGWAPLFPSTPDTRSADVPVGERLQWHQLLVQMLGFCERAGLDVLDTLHVATKQAIDALAPQTADPDAVREAVRDAINDVLRSHVGVRPIVTVEQAVTNAVAKIEALRPTHTVSDMGVDAARAYFERGFAAGYAWTVTRRNGAPLTDAVFDHAWENREQGGELPSLTADKPEDTQGLERAVNEAIVLIDEVNERKPSRDFYGIGQTLHAKLATIRLTLARTALSQGDR